MENCKQEIINFIHENKYEDVFITKNIFFELYKCNLYIYLRVSTERQEFGRQLLELYNWAKKKNITVCIDCIYCDKYTGKKTTRQQYEEMHKQLNENDYLVVSELNRLGRNWDNTKKEWQFLIDKNVNTIILDNDMLSAKLPNEKQDVVTLEYKFVRDIVFNAINYVASKKIEEVSTSTKDGLKIAKLKGKKIGKPRSKYSNKDNLIKTIELQCDNNLSQRRACLITKYPERTYKNDLKKLYEIYNTKDLRLILEKIK